MILSTKKLLITFLAIFVTFTAYANTKSPWVFKGYAVGEAVDNMHGGIKPGTILTAAGRLTATFDTEVAGWWRGGEFAFGVLGIGQTHGQTLYTGAIQTPSSMNGVSEIRINDLAYQHKFYSYVMLRAGIMDMDDWFNINETADLLLNTAFDNTIALSGNAELATYPYPGFGAMTQLGDRRLALLIGVFQGDPSHQHTVFKGGQLVIAEVSTHLGPDFMPEIPQPKHLGGGINTDAHYILKFGLWDYQQNLEAIGNTDHGLYVIAETNWQTINGKKLSGSIEFGLNPKKYGTISDSLAASLSVGALLACRPDDSLNFGIASAWQKGQPNAETVFEIGYDIQFIQGLVLTPDLQYITHPSGQYKNAWVGILRLAYTIPG